MQHIFRDGRRPLWRLLPTATLLLGSANYAAAQQMPPQQMPPQQPPPFMVQPEDVPSSSLYASTMRRQAAMYAPLPNAGPTQPFPPPVNNWYETPLPPPREIKKGDLIKIRVDLNSQMASEGEIQRRKNTQYDALLNDWVVLNGLRSVKPAPQTEGDQRIRGTQNQLYRATGELDTAETMKFNITATVVDVLPNGNIVVEAHWKINNNNEQWIRSLSGVVSRESIGPGNMVLGEDVAELHIGKQEIGHVRDSYKRGWVTRLLDVFSPF